MTTHKSGLTEEEKESERRLVRRERRVAVAAAILFVVLVAWPGHDALVQWNNQTVALLADAATAAAALGVPAAIIYGGADLIAWIVREVKRAWRSEAITRPNATTHARRRFSVIGRVGSTSIRRDWITQGGLILFALALLFAPEIIGWATHLFTRREAVASAQVEQPPTSHPQPRATLPRYCRESGSAAICAAGADANSAEAIGAAVCGARGLGRLIFRTNQQRHGFTFDEYHVPPGTEFDVQCGPR